MNDHKKNFKTRQSNCDSISFRFALVSSVFFFQVIPFNECNCYVALVFMNRQTNE
jgi:hypothetical protein